MALPHEEDLSRRLPEPIVPGPISTLMEAAWQVLSCCAPGIPGLLKKVAVHVRGRIYTLVGYQIPNVPAEPASPLSYLLHMNGIRYARLIVELLGKDSFVLLYISLTLGSQI
jgi:hypothetical protein